MQYAAIMTTHYQIMPFIRINNTVTNHLPAEPMQFPLPLSLVLSSVRTYGDFRFTTLGFKKYTRKHGLVFWKKSRRFRTRRLLFFHGLGFGAMPYIELVESIFSRSSTGYSDCVVVDLPARNIGLSPVRTEVSNSPGNCVWRC